MKPDNLTGLPAANQGFSFDPAKVTVPSLILVAGGEDRRRLTGRVETMDGAGERLPFIDIDELAAILNRLVRPRKRRGKRSLPADA